MKSVQDALRETDIPAYAEIWQPTAEYPELPEAYLVYSTMTTEDDHHDDIVTNYRVYVYLNLWTAGDSTEAVKAVRRAMYAAGFAMDEETTKGYKQPAYNEMINYYCTSWTWVGYEEAGTCAWS